jgi:hypothetical protein
MKGTPMWRITVTSSLNELSTDQLGNRKGVRSEVLLSRNPPLSAEASGQKFKDDVNGFSSTSYIYSMAGKREIRDGN